LVVTAITLFGEMMMRMFSAVVAGMICFMVVMKKTS